ncbi:MAG: hypothetical protein JRC99_12905, partial [Deltaproteobacteria bacterium]|nr:hypothetical protein [Deltaproteobacteria bacterium]
YIRSVVSDPFGSFDITGADLTLTDAGGNQVVQPPTIWNDVIDSGGATKTYEYMYTIPAAPAAGDWSAAVTAAEGTEGTVTHTETGSISILTSTSNLSTSTKSVTDLNGGDAEPGDTLRYSIDIIETSGAAASSVQVTDTIPADVNSFTIV